MNKQRTITFLLAEILFLISAARVSAAPKVSREQLMDVERQVKVQEIERKRLQAKSLEVGVEMTKLNNSLVEAAKKIQDNEKKLSSMEEELGRLQTQLEKSEEQLQRENYKVAETVAALQNLARKPTEALFVQPLTPVEVIRSAMLLREIVPSLTENAEVMKKQLKNIADQKKGIEESMENIKKQQSSLAKEHSNLKALMDKKKSMQKDLETKTAESRKKSEQLASQANDLRELVEKIEKEQQIRKQKQEEEKRRLERERELSRQQKDKTYAKPASDNLIKNNQDIIKEIGKKFAKAKGLLSRPAAGPVVVSYGQETAKGVTSKGIYIKTRGMAQVVAPFDGAVVFSGPFKGYGNMIIIEHGGGYLSLLSGLDEMDCEIGQMLLAGEPVGQMPEKGDQRLYMEIRKDSLPINPEIWLAK